MKAGADPARLRPVLRKLKDVEHLELEGADHSLARSRKTPMADADVWLDAVADFVRRVSA